MPKVTLYAYLIIIIIRVHGKIRGAAATSAVTQASVLADSHPEGAKPVLNPIKNDGTPTN